MLLETISDIHFFQVELPLEVSLYNSLHERLTSVQKSFADKRKQELVAGRYCARKALEQIDSSFYDIFLEMTESRAPIWPGGVCGSISHNKNMAIAVVSNKYRSLGVDIELLIPFERLKKLENSFINESEKTLTREDTLRNSTIIFSAKESLFKLLHPLCHTYFGFLEAELKSITAEGFVIELMSNKPEVQKFNGEYVGSLFETPGGIGTLLSLK